MRIENLTPHAINIRQEDGQNRVIPPSGQIARVSVSDAAQEPICGIPVVKSIFGEVTGLPAPEDGVFLLVSSMVAQAAQRPDVLSPNTGPTAIRENGQVVAVRGLQRFA